MAKNTQSCKNCGWGKKAHSAKSKKLHVCGSFTADWKPDLSFSPLEPANTATRSGLEPWDPGLASMWYISPSDHWTTAYRLMAQAENLVVGEVRIFPTDLGGNYMSDPGEWSQEPEAVVTGGLRARDLRFTFDAWRTHSREILKQMKDSLDRADFEAIFDHREIPLVAIEQLGEPPSRRKRWNDHQYAALASRYAEIAETGERSVIKMLAEEINLSRDRTRDLVHETRRRGFLTPTKQGIAAGRLTDRAHWILDDHGEES